MFLDKALAIFEERPLFIQPRKWQSGAGTLSAGELNDHNMRNFRGTVGTDILDSFIWAMCVVLQND